MWKKNCFLVTFCYFSLQKHNKTIIPKPPNKSNNEQIYSSSSDSALVFVVHWLVELQSKALVYG